MSLLQNICAYKGEEKAFKENSFKCSTNLSTNKAKYRPNVFHIADMRFGTLIVVPRLP